MAVNVGTKTTIDVELSITSTESIDVVAGEAGVQVNTSNEQIQTVVSERQIKELPTITRNPYNLVGLSPNVNPNDAGGGGGRGAGFSINGARNSRNNILLDGSDNNDQFTASVGQDVPLDSVRSSRF